MKRTNSLALVFTLAAFVVVTASCDLTGGGGGGGTGGGSATGGGGGTSVTFKKGFTFVRKDDRNVYMADSSDYQTTGVLTSSGTVHTPSLSKTGTRVVFVTGSGAESELSTVAVAGGAVSTVLAPTASAKNFRTPVFSPDGTRIAFTFDDGGLSSSIGLINVDGSNFTRLIGGSALAYAHPTFSADGTKVLAAAGNAGTQLTQLEVVDVATGTSTNLTNTLGNEAFAIANRVVLSPDGTLAAFDARVSSGVTRVFVINLTTKAVTKVNEYPAEPTANDSFPCWVDATTVAFSSDSGGNDNVYTLSNLTGTGSPRLQVPKAIEPWYGP